MSLLPGRSEYGSCFFLLMPFEGKNRYGRGRAEPVPYHTDFSLQKGIFLLTNY